MMPKVLYISYDGLTDPIGQSQVLAYITGLSKLGYSFTVLSAEKRHQYSIESETVNEICSENNIKWIPVFYTKRPPIFSTIWDRMKMSIYARKLTKRLHFDIVHCRSYISSLIGIKLKRNFGVKFIFDMRGFWADERVDGQLWDVKKPHFKWVYNYFKKKEQVFLKEADAIISLTHDAKDYMIKHWHVINRIDVIPCAVDTTLFSPKQIERDLSDRVITLGYLGSIGTWYMLDEMLSFFSVFLKKYPNSIFKFITKEPSSTIYKAAQSIGIGKDRIIVKAASRKQVPTELDDVDVGVFFIRPLFSKKSSSPIKQGEFMSMGIPVITNAGIGDTDQIIKKYHSGILISEFSDACYLSATEMVSDMLSRHKNHIRSGAIEYFSLEKGIQSYANVYVTLLS